MVSNLYAVSGKQLTFPPFQTRSHVIHGRPIHVRKAKPIAEMKRIRLKDDYDESQQKRVFIGGVPLEVRYHVSLRSESRPSVVLQSVRPTSCVASRGKSCFYPRRN